MNADKTLTDRESILSYWRDKFGEHNMRRFMALEAALLETLAELKNVMGPRASLAAYARHRAQEWLRSASNSSIDPDKLFISTRYRYRLGGREIIQDDRRSLTDFAIFGLQDKDRIGMTFDGQTSSGVSYFPLLNWLSQVDIRSEYALMLINEPQQAVHHAMQEYLVRQLEFTVFCDQIEHKLDDLSFHWVQRLLQGDPSMLIRGVVLPQTGTPMRNVFVISERRAPQGRSLLFAPGAPSGKVWHAFNTVLDLVGDIGTWARRHPEFVFAQVGSRFQMAARLFFQQLENNFDLWKSDSVRLLEFNDVKPGQPLFGVVSEQIRWDMFEGIELAPPNYRNASFDERQQFASLNTQLKALYTVEGREVALVSYAKFSYDLIKQRVEGVLKDRGEEVTVDPDLIMVEFSPSDRISLTSLIAQERSFYAVENDRLPVDSYPRYRLAPGHPAVKKLDIRDLASWSRTLRPGEKYIEMLSSVYLNPKDSAYSLRRQVHFERQQAEMNRAALSGYFQGQISREVLDDFQQAIAALRTPIRKDVLDINDFPIKENSVYRFHLGQRRPVEGVYVFRFKKGGAVHDFLYTPQAPDGIWYRPLEYFDSTIRVNGMRQYFIDRVKFVDRKFAVEYFDALEASKSRVNAPDLQVASRVRDISLSYEQMIQRVIDDVDAQTTSLAEIITKLTYDTVLLAAQVVSLVIPPVGLAVSAVQITRNILEGVEAYHYRDNSKVLEHFKEALVDLATLGYGKYKELGKQAVTTTQKTLIDLVKDTKTLAELVSKASGQKVPHEILLELVQDVLASGDGPSSKTRVR